MDYKSVFTNLCLELQQNRSWIKGLGKNPPKSELIHWRQCLLSGGTEACSLWLRETPACIHVIQRLSQPRVACWHGFRQNSQKTECVFTRCPTGGRKKIACIYGLRSEGVNGPLHGNTPLHKYVSWMYPVLICFTAEIHEPWTLNYWPWNLLPVCYIVHNYFQNMTSSNGCIFLNVQVVKSNIIQPGLRQQFCKYLNKPTIVIRLSVHNAFYKGVQCKAVPGIWINPDTPPKLSLLDSIF